MPQATVNGVRLAYEVHGSGDPVVMICGTGQTASSWDLHYVPALLSKAYSVITFDNRGMPPSSSPAPPYSAQAMAADTAQLIEQLRLGPCRVVGFSLGAFTAQELALERRELVRAVVLMGTFGRQDTFRRAVMKSWVELDRSGIQLPALYDTVSSSFMLFSPSTLDDDNAVELHLALNSATPAWTGDGRLGQHEADAAYDGRLEALAGIRVPATVIAFELDTVTPPRLCREVANAIPGCRYVEIPSTGHFGPFEKPEQVLSEISAFFEEV